MIEIMIDLQGGVNAPLYEKIYEYIRQDIIGGRILQGEKLPSTRLLARNLSVSRSTVEMAYEQLLAEGYIKAEPCRGFFVCDITELYQLGECPGSVQQEMPVWENVAEKAKKEIDFSPDAVDSSYFPYNIVRKVSKNVLAQENGDFLSSGDGQGDYGLRCAIASYLYQARGVRCEPKQILLGAGNEYLQMLLAQILGTDKKVLMENPTYLQAYRTFANMGYQMMLLPVGEEGMDLAQIRQCDPDIVYVMPSHQFPLGTIMPLQQRLLLLKWASGKEGCYLIEDDHDSEYRYRGKPIPSLQSEDRFGKVIYIGTFSKSIAPSLRISYMVLPPQLLERYYENCGFYSVTVPKMEQEILREFIRAGHFERHLNKMRGIYRVKHDLLLNELKGRPWVRRISGEHAGLYLLAEIRTDIPEAELCALAGKQGVVVTGISEYKIKTAGQEACVRENPVLLIGYGNPDDGEIHRGIEILDQIITGK